MIALLYQTCTISRRTPTGSVDGTPTFNAVALESNVPCRFDPLHTRLRPSTDSSNPLSYTDFIYGTLYVGAESSIDTTCIVTITGDTNVYEVVAVNKAPAFGSIHHIECDVRTVKHR